MAVGFGGSLVSVVGGISTSVPFFLSSSGTVFPFSIGCVHAEAVA